MSKLRKSNVEKGRHFLRVMFSCTALHKTTHKNIILL